MNSLPVLFSSAVLFSCLFRRVSLSHAALATSRVKNALRLSLWAWHGAHAELRARYAEDSKHL
ncbi:hypothetical protein DVU_1856 [Nitratidesulfovibrio vulgaris str. Hildenborough]|uniref:Uncharacterized protein n=1 Tax=Nitratidesulfovibrio vulgaris (strain ATCC 29579 / DSM 644 / CCUG 34227 / NCIMB 8303 / VKM B-1760 / Hildenborough) TaxID=882 RepID=Q72AY4_NITV2|nr:hypothetical protein DVU_1856 [Nitratidesulfovibrio vulgaris str. Hildenborough]